MVLTPRLQRTRVTVRVPATTANLGPGFDCIGMALDIWNELTVTVADTEKIEVFGEGAGVLPTDSRNLVLVGMKAAFKVGSTLLERENRSSSFDSASNLPTRGDNIVATSKDECLFEPAMCPTPIARPSAVRRMSLNYCTDKFVARACQQLLYSDYQGCANVVLPCFHYKCVNRIPFARGLGSSSAAVVAGLIAGLLLQGVELPANNEEALFNLACAIEGHPDNVAPAIYGGIQIGIKIPLKDLSTSDANPRDDATDTEYNDVALDENEDPRLHTKWITSQVPFPSGLQCILFLPDATTETAAARAILPSDIPLKEAIHNVSRAAMLINALSRGNLDALCVAMDDNFHQPYRGASKEGRHLYPLIAAALKAGAHGACLSGAGPAVLAITSGAKGDIFTQRQGERMDNLVADALLQTAEKLDIKGRIFITHPSLQGAHVVLADPPYSVGKVCHFAGGASI